MSDAEFSVARSALRDAVTLGAQYYVPRMYASAQAMFDAATASREEDPVRCRSLLAGTTAAANSARQAALEAYKCDVTGRFEASVKKLEAAGADRAYPDEFSRLAAGITTTARWFAAGSYWDARMSAYTTLKGMEDLYEEVTKLREWLGSASGQVEKAIETARALGAGAWAPAQMKDAEERYQDALAQAQAGHLPAAADSMKAAWVIATRLPLLRPPAKEDAGEPSAVGPAEASRPNVPERGEEQSARGPAAQSRPAPTLPSGQKVRIAEMSMRPLGAPQKLYTAFSAVVARFDVVAAEGLKDAGVMEKVLSGLGDSWEAAVSEDGNFGFIFDERIQMVKDLGSYREGGRLPYAPYAAQFRLVGTPFRVNLVICTAEAAGTGSGTDGADALAKVHRYFETLTGNRGITILLAAGPTLTGHISSARMQSGEIVPLRASQAAPNSRADGAPPLFGSLPLQPLVETSGLGSSTPPVAYIILAGK